MKRKKVLLSARCDGCGMFRVIRERKPRPSTDGITVNDLPQSVVCPKCRMWAKVSGVEDIQSA